MRRRDRAIGWDDPGATAEAGGAEALGVGIGSERRLRTNSFGQSRAQFSGNNEVATVKPTSSARSSSRRPRRAGPQTTASQVVADILGARSTTHVRAGHDSY
jgi:hypothetical protein